MVSISYQRIKHVWCERICDLDTQGAYLQRERYGFFYLGAANKRQLSQDKM